MGRIIIINNKAPTPTFHTSHHHVHFPSHSDIDCWPVRLMVLDPQIEIHVLGPVLRLERFPALCTY